jgi:hypothetical protein
MVLGAYRIFGLCAHLIAFTCFWTRQGKLDRPARCGGNERVRTRSLYFISLYRLVGLPMCTRFIDVKYFGIEPTEIAHGFRLVP